MRSLLAIVVLAALIGVAAGQGSICLQTPAGLPAGNGQNGAMFDIQATSTVVIQDFHQAFFSGAGATSNMEVYAVAGGGTFVGNETNPGAWTLRGTATGILIPGPGMATPLGLNLGFIIAGGTTQGFYVTSSSASTIAYTNGAGTPGVSIITSDPMISVTEGVGKSYPFGSTFSPRNWNGNICYDPGMGLFSSFTGTPTSGGAPLAVQFTDTSFTSDPAGIQSWAWDFGDGNNSGVQNPMHTYTCPGSYSVTLVVTDTMNPLSSLTRTGYITVTAPSNFSITTTGGGVGDLTLTPIDTVCFPTATRGFTLPTFAATPGIFGNGPFLGITPDIVTLTFITQPALPGHISHFVVTPTTYPNSGPVMFPPGFFSALTGTTVDAVQVLLNANGNLVFVSNVSQVTF
jgi:PKD repeat protein